MNSIVRWIDNSLVHAKKAIRHYEVNDIILSNLLVHVANRELVKNRYYT